MRLADAVRVLAGTLPASTEKFAAVDVLTDATAQAEQRDYKEVLSQHTLEALLAPFPKRFAGANWKNKSFGRHTLQRRLLKNIQDGDMMDMKECDPSSVAPDVGILSCGAGNYCMESQTSKLGGVCRSLRGTTLKNHVFDKSEDVATKAATVKECDPAPSSSSSDADILGVLACGAGLACAKNIDSKLGGVCAPSSGNLDRHLEDGNDYDPEEVCDPDSNYYNELCNCGDWNTESNTGTIACATGDICLGPILGEKCSDTCRSRTMRYERTNVGYTTTVYYSVHSPREQVSTLAQISYRLDSPDEPTCSFSVNGIECATCEIDEDTYGDWCYSMDCTNAAYPFEYSCADQEGGSPDFVLSCLSEEYCYICDLSPYGPTNPYTTVFFPDGSNSTCLQLHLSGILGAMPPERCEMAQTYASDICCAGIGSCNICPAGLVDPSAYIQMGGARVRNCSYISDIGDNGALGNSGSQTCIFWSMYVSERCCGIPIPGSCPLCPDIGYVVNPGASVELAGNMYNCLTANLVGTVDGFGGDAECETARSSTSAVCCELYFCNICGAEDEQITVPEAMVTIPQVNETFTCQEFEYTAQQGGFYSAETCEYVQLLVAGPCGCTDNSGTDTTAPTSAPAASSTGRPTTTPTRTTTVPPSSTPPGTSTLTPTAAPTPSQATDSTTPTVVPTSSQTGGPTISPTVAPTTAKTSEPTPSSGSETSQYSLGATLSLLSMSMFMALSFTV